MQSVADHPSYLVPEQADPRGGAPPASRPADRLPEDPPRNLYRHGGVSEPRLEGHHRSTRPEKKHFELERRFPTVRLLKRKLLKYSVEAIRWNPQTHMALPSWFRHSLLLGCWKVLM